MHFWGQCPYIDTKEQDRNFVFKQKKHDKVEKARQNPAIDTKYKGVIKRNAAFRAGARRRKPLALRLSLDTRWSPATCA